MRWSGTRGEVNRAHALAFAKRGHSRHYTADRWPYVGHYQRGFLAEVARGIVPAMREMADVAAAARRALEEHPELWAHLGASPTLEPWAAPEHADPPTDEPLAPLPPLPTGRCWACRQPTSTVRRFGSGAVCQGCFDELTAHGAAQRLDNAR